MNERLKCFSDDELFVFQYALIRANPGFYGMFPPKETSYTRTAKNFSMKSITK